MRYKIVENPYFRAYWCHGGDLNSRPPAYETSALTSWATVTLKSAIIFNVCLYIDKIFSFLRSRAPKSQILKFKFAIFGRQFVKFKPTKIQIWGKNTKNRNLHFQGAGFAAQIWRVQICQNRLNLKRQRPNLLDKIIPVKAHQRISALAADAANQLVHV